MSTELRWVEGPWKGKLAIAARPRGGDWLEDEIAAWRRLGVTTVVSLLTPEEENELDLMEERAVAQSYGLGFLSLPVPDREVPASESEVTAMLARLDALGAMRERTDAVPIRRALHNLRSVLQSRLGEGLDKERMHDAAALIDEVAQKIERL